MDMLRETARTQADQDFHRFNIGSSGQQIHITDRASEDPKSSRHPCFKVNTREELEEVKQSIYDHHVRGGPAAPMAADKPGEANSGQFISCHEDFV